MVRLKINWDYKQCQKIWRFQTWAAPMGFTHNCGLSLLKLHFFFNTICLPILAGFGAFIRSESLLGPQALGWKILCSNFGISGTWLKRAEPHHSQSLQDDIVSLLSKRVYDVAGSTLVARQCWWFGHVKGLRSKVLGFLGLLKPPTPSTGSLWFGFWSTFKELWFVPVGPLCCVLSMLWISKLK